MGESDDELVDVVFALRELDPDWLPVNFLIPFEGTRRPAAARFTCAACSVTWSGCAAAGPTPMIVLPQGAGPDPLEDHFAEREWVPRPGPAFVMTAEVADIPASGLRRKPTRTHGAFSPVWFSLRL
jgi:hypothetical protein